MITACVIAWGIGVLFTIGYALEKGGPVSVGASWIVTLIALVAWPHLLGAAVGHQVL